MTATSRKVEPLFTKSLGDDAELCPLEPWQAGELLAHMDRGREFIGRYIGLPHAVVDLESARTFLRSYADKARDDLGRIWGIRIDGTLVGGVLFRVMDVQQGTAEAGCWLEPAAVGRGLVTRASRLIIDWAIRDRGIHRVEWMAAAGNTASIAVAKRLGMTHEGILRQCYLHPGGERLDLEVWSVLAPEWLEQASSPAPLAEVQFEDEGVLEGE